jgi:hypothetical protein
MNVIPVIQLVSGAIAGAGAKTVIKMAVDKVTPTVMSKTDKILVGVGTWALGTTIGVAVGDSVSKVATDMLEFGQKAVEDIKSTVENKKKEMEETKVLPRET